MQIPGGASLASLRRHGGRNLTCAALAACLAGCATPEPARYFELELKLAIDNVPHEFTYNWHCREILDGPNFGPGGLLKARWQWSPPTYMVLKRLKNDAALLFAPPQTCDGNFSEGSWDKRAYDPALTFIDSLGHPTHMDIYPPGRTRGSGHDVRLISATIRRLAHAVPDYAPSPEERSAKQLLRERSHGFQAIRARILPASVWQANAEVANYFKDAKGILVAPNTGNQQDRDRFFPVQHLPHGFNVDWDDYAVPLTRGAGEWTLSADGDVHSARLYQALLDNRQMAGASIGQPPEVTVNYRGVTFTVQNSREIFDADRRLLIQFVNDYRAYPWLSADE